MFRRLLFVAGALALVIVFGGPSQANAQHSRGGSHHGMPHGMHRRSHPGFTPGFRGLVIDPRFVPRRFDRFEDLLESRFPFGRFDRFEDRLENRLRLALLPHFVGGFVPGFPSMIPFGFPGMFGY
jgi:hypothetical protein